MEKIIRRKKGIRIDRVLCLLAILLFIQTGVNAQTVTEGGTRIGPPTVVQNIPVPPCDKDPCTDIHVRLWQKEDNINILGWRVEISDFTNSNSVRTDQPEPSHSKLDNLSGIPATNNPDNGSHAVNVSADGAVIPKGGRVRVNVQLWLTHWNVLRIDNLTWTNATPPDPNGRAAPNHGWHLDYPKQDPSNLSSFNHTFCMFNDDTVKYLNVTDIAFNASMFWDRNLTSNVYPYSYPDVNISPGGSWCGNITTYDSLIGGHIYFKYNISGNLDGSPTTSESTADHLVSENGTNFRDNPSHEDTPPTVLSSISYDDFGIMNLTVSDVVNAVITVQGFSTPTRPSNSPQSYIIIPSKKSVTYSRSKITYGTASYRITATDTGGHVVSACPLFLQLSRNASEPVSYNGSLSSTESKFSIDNNGVTNIQIDLNGNKLYLLSNPVRRGHEGSTFFIPEYGYYFIDLSPYMNPENNTITIKASGKPGGNADILISE